MKDSGNEDRAERFLLNSKSESSFSLQPKQLYDYIKYCDFSKTAIEGTVKSAIACLTDFHKENNYKHLNALTLQEYFVYVKTKRENSKGQAIGSPSVYNGHLWALKKLICSMPWAQDKITKRNLDEFFEKFKPAKTKSNNYISDVNILTREEMKELLKKLDKKKSNQKWKAIILALYETGARVSELIELRKNDVTYLESENIYTAKIIGKGGGSSEVSLSAYVYELLKKAFVVESSPTLIHTSNGNKMDRNNISKALTRVGESNINRTLTPHMLRHSCLTHLADAGITLPNIAAKARHSQASTTANFYLHGNKSAGKILEKLNLEG